MANHLQAFAEELRRLDRAVAGLAPVAASIGVEPPAGRQWFELLRKKLLPQLDVPPLLVVGIVGGTNIGKSVIFNHLAGEVASGVSPLAAGTRHPVCLVPPGADNPELLARLFEPFELRAWQSPRDPLEEAPENRLFWRAGSRTPARLLLIDAPDVDSDVVVNWERARAIRQASDVLMAVLTQQKYNDAAVKEFFRSAVEADKPIIVVFNQCNLTADAQFWPQWLSTFCEETGARPELVYVVPYDRDAAEALRLPFHSVGPEGRWPLGDPADLRDELASLRFDTIKIRTFRGALARVLDPQRGAAAYLETIRTAAGQFSAAAAALSATEMARVAWPTLPAGVLVEEIRRWWDTGRGTWSRRIHGFYRALGRGATWPVRTAWQTLAGEQVEPLAAFQQQERRAILLAVEKMLDELERLAQVGNDTLRPRLARLLGGDARADLLRRVQTAHDDSPTVDEDYRAFLESELEAWKAANPRAVRFLQSLDHAWAIARPTITVALVVSSWGLAGGLVGSAGHAAGELATEAAIAGGLTGGGEALVSTTSEGVRQAAARLFTRLQSRYADGRARWLAAWLEGQLLGELLGELHDGAEAPRHEAFHQAESAMQRLRAAAG
ncbi:MAG: 50S ribosome-binding GTPase [Pirellulales bacterium]|nr:50S ribosome-binding GTPase [Pirellulales bacterium]